MNHETLEDLKVTGSQENAINSDSDDVSSDDKDDEKDEEMMMGRAKCLFCPEDFPTPQEVFLHCNNRHQFNIVSLTKQHHLDFYDYVKLINFTRKMLASPPTLTTPYPHHECPWSSEEYLMPVLNDDPLLSFDIESDLESTLPTLSRTPQNGNSQSINNHPQNITLTYDQYNQLLSDLETSKKQNSIYSKELEHVLADLNKLRSSSINQSNLADFCNNSNKNKMGNNSNNNNGGDDDDVRRLDEDAYYFQSYDHYGIHEEMLKDTVRTLAYQEAILQNADAIKNKKVLDLGCGTSILSLFMAKAGAEVVYAVDQSDVIYKAMQIVRENGLGGVVTCLKGRIEDITLPSQKVDVIVSEWMGYFLLFESMLESVLWARDHLLGQGGLLMPDKCQILLGAFEDAQMHQSRIAYWDEVYAFSMTTMKLSVLQEAQVEVLRADAIVTNEECVYDLDLMTCSKSDLDFSHPFALHATRTADITGFYAYFTSTFDLPHKVVMTTSPQTTPTHWKQTLFLLPKPLSVEKGECIEGKIRCRRDVKDTRSFIITITLRGGVYKYHLS